MGLIPKEMSNFQVFATPDLSRPKRKREGVVRRWLVGKQKRKEKKAFACIIDASGLTKQEDKGRLAPVQLTPVLLPPGQEKGRLAPVCTSPIQSSYPTRKEEKKAGAYYLSFVPMRSQWDKKKKKKKKEGLRLSLLAVVGAQAAARSGGASGAVEWFDMSWWVAEAIDWGYYCG